jgi:oxygen-independent coproporphyrinogen-3 oxidase
MTSSTIDKERLIAKARTRLDDLRTLQELGLICKDGDFFPSVHYPPITMYPPITEDEMFKDYSLPEDGLVDVYAHIPFCERRCVFCHYPVRLGPKYESEKDQYLDALEKEMDIYLARLGVNRVRARSILVGGGTPTYLTLPQMRRFLESFVARVDISGHPQFNYDVDPNTLLGDEGMERLRMMRDFGVDRLTIGVQSLNDRILKLMNRPHDVKEALESIENSKRLGFQVNIEFIFGYPGQTLENWAEVVEQAAQLDVDEIQLYRLKVDAYGDYQGPIKRFGEIHPSEMPTVDDTLVMKQMAIDILGEYGYHENMRRVFSRKPEHYSHYAHNQCCKLYDEVGFGLTAFSSLRNRFILNTQYFDEYYAKIAEGKLPLNRGLVRNQEEQERWAIVLPLKNRSVRRNDYLRATGVPLDSVFNDKMERLAAAGLVEVNDKEIVLTKLGAFFADEVAQQFHHPDYMPFPKDSYQPGPLYPYGEANRP